MRSGNIAGVLFAAIISALLSGCSSLERDEPAAIVGSKAGGPAFERAPEAVAKEKAAGSAEDEESALKEDETEAEKDESAAVIAKATHYFDDGSITMWNEYEYITITPQQD